MAVVCNTSLLHLLCETMPSLWRTCPWMGLLVFLTLPVAQSSKGVKLENVALGKPAAQSSTYWNYKAGNAVDGNLNLPGPGFCPGCYCAHTWKNKYPWWRVDLGANYTVHAVKITNRYSRQSYKRLKNFSVFVGLSPKDRSSACIEREPGLGRGETRTFNCSQPITGRYVTLALANGYHEILNFCEFEVLAEIESEANISSGC